MKMRFSQKVEGVLSYVNGRLASSEGGFYSAEDADSLPTVDAIESQEGVYYTWDAKDIRIRLCPSVDDAESKLRLSLFLYLYGVSDHGNVRDPPKELKGKVYKNWVR